MQVCSGFYYPIAIIGFMDNINLFLIILCPFPYCRLKFTLYNFTNLPFIKKKTDFSTRFYACKLNICYRT